jgi:hypothetical protein
MLRAAAVPSEAACSGVMPGRRRAMARIMSIRRVAGSTGFAAMRSGSQKAASVSGKAKPRAATPMMRCGFSFRTSVWPTADGLAP